MNYWILKTEPSTYSFDDLKKAGSTVWDGVKNPVALKHIRAMQPGDQVLIYHTGDEKSIVGHAEITSAAYPDPQSKDLAVVNLRAGKSVSRPVTLAAIKADPAFAELGLVRMGRLSVVPATEAQWKRLVAMSEPAAR